MSPLLPRSGRFGSTFPVIINTYFLTVAYFGRAPYLVVLKDRGQTLRFYRPQHLRLSGDAMRSFLEQEGWNATPPWSSAYAPGGSRYFTRV
jgi:hypothetical protein